MSLKMISGFCPLRGANIIDFIEKPECVSYISVVLCIINYILINSINKNYFDIPDFILSLIKNNIAVKTYHLNGYWFDVGHPRNLQLLTSQIMEDKNVI